MIKIAFLPCENAAAGYANPVRGWICDKLQVAAGGLPHAQSAVYGRICGELQVAAGGLSHAQSATSHLRTLLPADLW